MGQNHERKHALNYFTQHLSGPIPFCMQLAANRAGNHVLILGGTHGNEPGGVGAVVQMHQAIQRGEIELKSGRISFLLANPRAYEANVRYLDRDLNRAFEDHDPHSVEGRRVSEINRLFDGHADICAALDLHSVSIGNFKIVVYDIENAVNSDLAKRISPIDIHLAYHRSHLPGALVDEAGRRGMAGLMVECGNHSSADGIQTALQHIYALLGHYGILSTSFSPNLNPPARILQYESLQAIRPRVGFRFLIDGIATGTRLVKGQVFAADDQGEHAAPEDCYVAVPSRHAKPTDYDAGFLCKLKILEESTRE